LAHLENAAETLFLVLDRVVHAVAGTHYAGVNAEEDQLANIGVGHDLEGKPGKGSSSLALFAPG
jgi:hypothetical protein